MKHINNIANIVRIAYGAVVCVALVANMLGAREKSVVIAVVIAVVWACTRIIIEGATAVREFMVHGRHGAADVDGLYALLKKNSGTHNANVWYHVSWHEGVPSGVYHVYVSGDACSVPPEHNGAPVFVFMSEHQVPEPT